MPLSVVKNAIIRLYADRLDLNYSEKFSITEQPSEEFYSFVYSRNNKATVKVSTGAKGAVNALLAHLQGQNYLPKLTENALTWLVLHELQHYDLGHFDLLGCDYLTETERAHDLALVSHRPARVDLLAGIEPDHRWMVEPCLEMQADHDAIEMMLGAYSANGWAELRERAAAISTMMVLIEKHDEVQRFERSSHPKAATRIFQLLGHIIEMPLLPARYRAEAEGRPIDPDELPSQAEMEAFHREVVIPTLQDAKLIAEAAGAKSIIDDLGNLDDFIADVRLGIVEGSDAADRLKTVGARQWAELFAFNPILMQRLGHV